MYLSTQSSGNEILVHAHNNFPSGINNYILIGTD